MCSDAWLAMLEALAPSLIVLAALAPETGPAFQPGLVGELPPRSSLYFTC